MSSGFGGESEDFGFKVGKQCLWSLFFADRVFKLLIGEWFTVNDGCVSPFDFFLIFGKHFFWPGDSDWNDLGV